MFCILSSPHHPSPVCKMNVIRWWNGLDDTAKWLFSRDEMHHFSWFNKIRWRVKELSMEGNKKETWAKLTQTKKEKLWIELLFYCDFAGIQTRNLLIRSQMLYSVELRSHPFRMQWKVTSLGFKPGTFWSVVRCSIQLSYEAISLFACAKVILFIK